MDCIDANFLQFTALLVLSVAIPTTHSIETSSITVAEGSVTTLICPYQPQLPLVTWRRDNVTGVGITRYSLRYNEADVTITDTKFNYEWKGDISVGSYAFNTSVSLTAQYPRDDGIIVCHGNLSIHSEALAKYNLTITAPPKITSITSNGKTFDGDAIYAAIGSTLLSVNVRPGSNTKSKVFWFIDDKLVQMGDATVYVIEMTSSLNGSLLLVKVENEIGNNSLEKTLTLPFGPIIILTPNTTSYTRNETQSLLVIAAISSLPPVTNSTWIVGETVLSDTTQLSIKSVDRSHDGVITLWVSNGISTESIEITLMVNYPPSVNMKRRGNGVLECSVTAGQPNDLDIHLYLVIKGDNADKSKREIAFSNKTAQYPVAIGLIFYDSRDTRRRHYICTARNVVGSDEAKFDLPAPDDDVIRTNTGIISYSSFITLPATSLVGMIVLNINIL